MVDARTALWSESCKGCHWMIMNSQIHNKIITLKFWWLPLGSWNLSIKFGLLFRANLFQSGGCFLSLVINGWNDCFNYDLCHSTKGTALGAICLDMTVSVHMRKWDQNISGSKAKPKEGKQSLLLCARWLENLNWNIANWTCKFWFPSGHWFCLQRNHSCRCLFLIASFSEYEKIKFIHTNIPLLSYISTY